MAGPAETSPSWSWLLAPAVLASNVIASFQWLASARTVAVWVACYFLFIACRRAGQARVDGGVITLAVVVSGTILALHGLYQSLIGFDAMSNTAGVPGALAARIASGRAVATLGLPGALAGFLALSLPLTLSRTFSTSRGGLPRVLAAVAAVAQVCGLMATRSAAGVASLAAAGALVLWWSSRANSSQRRLAMTLMVAGLFLSALLLATRFSGAGSASEGAGPFALRAGNWKVAALILGDHPMLGAGAGCYGIGFPQYRTWGMNESQYAHNSYLQFFAECGLPLGVAALTVVVLLLYRLRALANGSDRAEDRFLAVSCVAFLLHNLVDFTFFLPSVAFTFIMLAGIASARGRSDGDHVESAASPVRIASALILALFAVLVTRADRTLQTAREAIIASVAAGEAAGRAVAANPWDPQARSLLSHLQLETGLASGNTQVLRESEVQAQRAIDLDPMTPHHWHHLGRVRLALGDPVGAYIAMQRATELYPIKIEYRDDRDRVGAMLQRQGR